jgi:hypothetical protein
VSLWRIRNGPVFAAGDGSERMSRVYQRGSLRKVKRANGNEVCEWRYRVKAKMQQQMLRVADFPTKKAV